MNSLNKILDKYLTEKSPTIDWLEMEFLLKHIPINQNYNLWRKYDMVRKLQGTNKWKGS